MSMCIGKLLPKLFQQPSQLVILLLTVILLSFTAFTAFTAAAQEQAEGIFPQAFLVEHYIAQVDTDGGHYSTEPVVDHYVRDRIVSVRPDASRVIVDFSQRQITEIKPDSSSYSVLSFDQMVELQRRLRAADRAQVGLPPETSATEREDLPGDNRPGFKLDEAPLRDGVDPETAAKSADGRRDLLDRPGVRHLRISLDQGAKAKQESPEMPVVDVWVDPGLRLGPAALTALDRFENEVLTPHATAQVPFARYVAAARQQSGGAFPIRTSRPLATGGTSGKAGNGAVHDIATRLERLAEVPQELLEISRIACDPACIPDGYQRTVHPLEQMVAFAEEEAELNQRALRGAK